MTLLSLWPPFHLVVLKVWSPDPTSSITPGNLLQMHPRPTGAGATLLHAEAWGPSVAVFPLGPLLWAVVGAHLPSTPLSPPGLSEKGREGDCWASPRFT